mgnify:CR=1 FL=1
MKKRNILNMMERLWKQFLSEENKIVHLKI